MSTFETIIKKNNLVSNYLVEAEKESKNLNNTKSASFLDDLKNSFYNVSSEINTLNLKADEIYSKRNELYENLISAELASYYGKKVKSLLNQVANLKDVKNILDINLTNSKLSNTISEISYYLNLDENLINSTPEFNSKIKEYGDTVYNIFCDIKNKLGYSNIDFDNETLTGFNNIISFINSDASGAVRFIKENKELNISNDKESVPDEVIVSLELQKDFYKENGTSEFPFIISSEDDFKDYMNNSTDDKFYILDKSLVINENGVITKSISNLDLNGFRLDFRKDSEIHLSGSIKNGSLVFKSSNNSDIKIVFENAAISDITFYTSTNINFSGTNGSSSTFQGDINLFAIQEKNNLKVSGSGFIYENGKLTPSSGATLDSILISSKLQNPIRIKEFDLVNKTVFLNKSFTEGISRTNEIIKISDVDFELELNQNIDKVLINKLIIDNTNINFSSSFDILKDISLTDLPNIYRLFFLLGSISEIRKLNFELNDIQKDINELLIILDGSFVNIIKNMIEENLKLINDYISSFLFILSSRKSNDSGYSNKYIGNLEEILNDLSDNILAISSTDISNEDEIKNYFLNVNISVGKFNQEALNLISGIIPSLIKINGYIDDYIVLLNSDENYGEKLLIMLKVLANSIGTPNNSDFKFRCFPFRDYESWRDGILSYTSEGICGLTPLYISQELGMNANNFSLLESSDEAILYKKLVNDSLERIARKNLLRSEIKYEEELNYEAELINNYNLKVVNEPSREEIPYNITDLIPNLKTLNTTNIESVIYINIQPENNKKFLLDENESTKLIYQFIDIELIKYIFKTQYDKEIAKRIYDLAEIIRTCKQNFKVLLIGKRFLNILNNIIIIKNNENTGSYTTILSEKYISEIESAAMLLNNLDEKIRKYISVWLFRTCTSNTISCSAIGNKEKTLLNYLYTRESAIRSYSEYNSLNQNSSEESILTDIFEYIKEFYNDATDFISNASNKIFDTIKSVLGL